LFFSLPLFPPCVISVLFLFSFRVLLSPSAHNEQGSGRVQSSLQFPLQFFFVDFLKFPPGRVGPSPVSSFLFPLPAFSNPPWGNMGRCVLPPFPSPFSSRFFFFFALLLFDSNTPAGALFDGPFRFFFRFGILVMFFRGRRRDGLCRIHVIFCCVFCCQRLFCFFPIPPVVSLPP